MNDDIDDFTLRQGILFIEGDIDSSTYLKFAKELRFVLSLDINPIILYIHTSGGELEAGLSIIDEYQLVSCHKKEIYTVGIGQVYSTGALILAYGDKRFGTESASFMIHPTFYDLSESEHQSAKTFINHADKVYNDIMTSLAIKCGRQNPKELKKFMEEIRDGKWMDTDGAKEFGLIDDKWEYSLEIRNT